MFALTCWLVVPVALSYAATQPYLNVHLFWWRYLGVVVPPLCLLAAIGVTTMRWQSARFALAVIVLALAMPAALSYYATARRADFRTAAQWVEGRYQPGDGLIYLPGLICSIPMQYYQTVYPGPARYTADAPGVWQWDAQRTVPYGTLAVAAYSAARARIFVIMTSYGIDAATAARMRAELAWLDSHYRFVSQYATLRVTVRLYAITRGPTALRPPA
jgi:hypothetical protein